MQYLVIWDYGYEGYHPVECNNEVDLVQQLEARITDIHGVYEIKRELTSNEIDTLRETTARKIAVEREELLSRLTDYEKQLLGVE